MTELYARLSEAFARLRPLVERKAKGSLKYDYLVPGGYYQESWDWDGFFIGLHMLTRKGEGGGHLKNWALNFLSAMSPDGHVPGCITPAGPEPGHRSFFMKPFLAQGAFLASRAIGDFSWAAEPYERLKLIGTRRERTNCDPRYGLFTWDNAMQSGADNNPALTNDPNDRCAIISCDVNTFQLREYLALSATAEELGHAADAAEFARKADALKEAFVRYQWCEADETCWNIRRADGQFVKRVSYSNFVPLVQNLLPPEPGRRMIQRYLWNESHMLSRYGLRTLSRQDAEYNNRKIITSYSNWQGPVWPIANYLYFRGLMNYGFREEARRLADTLAELCLKDIAQCASMHENYDAETGVPLAPSGTPSPSGPIEGGFIGWNLLVLNMQEELIAGDDPLDIVR